MKTLNVFSNRCLDRKDEAEKGLGVRACPFILLVLNERNVISLIQLFPDVLDNGKASALGLNIRIDC